MKLSSHLQVYSSGWREFQFKRNQVKAKALWLRLLLKRIAICLTHEKSPVSPKLRWPTGKEANAFTFTLFNYLSSFVLFPKSVEERNSLPRS